MTMNSILMNSRRPSVLSSFSALSSFKVISLFCILTILFPSSTSRRRNDWTVVALDTYANTKSNDQASISIEEKNEYPIRNMTAKFHLAMEDLHEDGARFKIILSGKSACETAKNYESQILYVFDLSFCQDNNENLEKCQANFIVEEIEKGKKTRSSPNRKVIVFRNAHLLGNPETGSCEEMTRLNALWTIIDGKNDAIDLSPLLLFEENFPRDQYNERGGLKDHLLSQGKECSQIFNDSGFNVAAFTARLRDFHVEQEPESENCILDSGLVSNIPKLRIFEKINSLGKFTAALSLIVVRVRAFVLELGTWIKKMFSK